MTVATQSCTALDECCARSSHSNNREPLKARRYRSCLAFRHLDLRTLTLLATENEDDGYRHLEEDTLGYDMGSWCCKDGEMKGEI
jgi:hypothetical protein